MKKKESRQQKRRSGPPSIQTVDQFWCEIEALIDPTHHSTVPASVKWSAQFDKELEYELSRPTGGPGWRTLLNLTHDAICRRDASFLQACFAIADRTLKAGPDGEMWEMSYVSYIEDLRLPESREEADRVLDLMPKTLQDAWIRESPHGSEFVRAQPARGRTRRWRRKSDR